MSSRLPVRRYTPLARSLAATSCDPVPSPLSTPTVADRLRRSGRGTAISAFSKAVQNAARRGSRENKTTLTIKKHFFCSKFLLLVFTSTRLNSTRDPARPDPHDDSTGSFYLLFYRCFPVEYLSSYHPPPTAAPPSPPSLPQPTSSNSYEGTGYSKSRTPSSLS